MCQELQIFAVVYMYVLGCKLSFVRLCDSDFGITLVDDIIIGIACVYYYLCYFYLLHLVFTRWR